MEGAWCEAELIDNGLCSLESMVMSAWQCQSLLEPQLGFYHRPADPTEVGEWTAIPGPPQSITVSDRSQGSRVAPCRHVFYSKSHYVCGASSPQVLVWTVDARSIGDSREEVCHLGPTSGEVNAIPPETPDPGT